MAWTLFVSFLFAFKSVCPAVFQTPGVVKVPLGETVTLTCNTESVMAACSGISWYKIHPRMRELKLATAVVIKSDQENSSCSGLIHNVTVDDSGTYYCSVLYSVIAYIGNGSKVIVTEPNTQPTITLYIPDESLESSVSLQCLVFRVVPHEARIFWVVSGTAQTGWTESGWKERTEFSEFTQASLTLSSDVWMDGIQIECIVEVGGKNFSKSLKTGLNRVCTWILYVGPGSVLLIMVGVVVATVFLHRARKQGPNKRSADKKSQSRCQNERRCTHTAEGSNITEVQYTSLDKFWKMQ
ncbi:immunoglobulin kappa light chain-like isoform X2 [Brachyhypopomus gauderio]|uniref:immunoglobulin kappa light chain-like isoform X2 n=1 Tax=Brachyhypopomus gauderio TaxID=698409 RepID=UPI0040421BF6